MIRNNWKILPYSQICELLDIDKQQLAFILKESDFLNEKLGSFKPIVKRVKYSHLTNSQKAKTQMLIKDILPLLIDINSNEFEFMYGEAKFNNQTNAINIINNTKFNLDKYLQFVNANYELQGFDFKVTINLSVETFVREEFTINIFDKTITVLITDKTAVLRALQYIAENFKNEDFSGVKHIKALAQDRLIYSYEAGCDNILDDETMSAFSDNLLASLCKKKINGIWFHAIFYQLAPFCFDESYSAGYKKRINMLNKIIVKAEDYGIKIYLYINEPRGMPSNLFKNNQDILGYIRNDEGTLCTSTNKVKEYIQTCAKKILMQSPNLGGYISITMSENLTNCYSKGQTKCGRCSLRAKENIVSEINNLIQAGIDESKTNAKLIAWTWAWFPSLGWDEQMVLDCVKKTNAKTAIMSTSEDSLILKNGQTVTDYSIVHIGPSAKTKKVFEQAKKNGHEIYAKVQLNNSWECPIAPFLPLFPLQYKHIKNLIECDVDGLMLSWTMGGYPSLVLDMVANLYYDKDYLLEDWYSQKYKDSARLVKTACQIFCDSLEHFPYCCMFMYVGPLSRGVASPMYIRKSNLQSCMIGYCYDDYEYWLSGYPINEFLNELNILIEIWEKGIALLSGNTNKDVKEIYSLAKTAKCCFVGAKLHLEFASKKANLQNKKELIEILDKEKQNVTELFWLMNSDGRIGFEPSNHYLFDKSNLLEVIMQLSQEKKKLAVNYETL